MASYYVHTLAAVDGDHEVHKEGCANMPSEDNRRYLGEFASCGPAVVEAKKYYTKANGCIHCSSECHK